MLVNIFDIFKGKSLSIICGSLKWLFDHNQHEKDRLMMEVDKLEEAKRAALSNSSDWFTSQTTEIMLNRKSVVYKLQLEKIIKYEEKIKKIQCNVNAAIKKSKFNKNTSNKVIEEDALVAGVDDLDDILDDEMVIYEEEKIKDNIDTDTDTDTEEEAYEPLKVGPKLLRV